MVSKQGLVDRVLPKISAALNKFIAPVSSSGTQAAVRPQKERPQDQPKGGFKRDRPAKADPPGTPRAGAPSQGAEGPRLTLVREGQPPPAQPSVASSFLQLFGALSGSRGAFLNWFGRGSYQASVKRNRRGPKLRKGAVLDQKAE